MGGPGSGRRAGGGKGKLKVKGNPGKMDVTSKAAQNSMKSARKSALRKRSK
jgi:hypothetical protein